MRHMKNRALSLLLALVLLLGILPPVTLTARAADESIHLTECDFTGTSYHSSKLGSSSIHTMQFDYNGGSTGFCGEHGKGMGRSLIGQSWGSRTEITDPTVKMMLAYYYAHTLGIFTDAAIAAGVNNVWNDSYVNFMNAWIQAIIWRYKQGTLTNPVEDCAEELMWVYNCLKGENNTDIHGHTEGLDESFYEIVNYIFLLGTETWGSAKVYEYRFTGPGSSAHSPDTVQSVVIGSLETTTGDTPNYKLIVKKVDAQTNVPLAGATFHIAKEGSSLQWNVTTSGTAGTATLDNLSAGTYAITETGAPNGYQIDNPGPEYVTLPANGENTVTKIFMDTSDTHPDGEIRKVDKDDPTKGLAGAVIAIQGVNNTFYGEYTTNASGYLEGVDWEQMGFGAYRAWELRAPEGYSLDNSVKTFRIESQHSTGV